MQLPAEFPPKTQYATINGCGIFYGSAGDPSNTPLLVLHGARGYGSHGADFRSFLPLTDKFFLVAMDMRGHGSSGQEGPITFEQISDDVEEFRKVVLEGRKTILLGGSFAGFMAQLVSVQIESVAVKFPDSLEALILRGTAPSYHQEEAAMVNLRAKMAAGGASNASVEMMEKVFSEGITSDLEFRLIMFAISPLYSESYDPNSALSSAINAQPHYLSHNSLYSNAEKFFDYRTRLPILGTKRVSVLCIVGEKDWICPVEESLKIKECVESVKGGICTVEVVKGANHAAHHEKPERVHALIRKFLGA